MANGDEGITPMVEKLKDSTDILEIEQEVEIAAPGTFVPPEEGEVDMDIDIEIITEDDGGVTIDFAPEEEFFPDEGDFYRNLAEEMDDGVLGAISNDLQAQYEGNKETRHDWEDTYSKGLELLGFKYEERTQPFRGATGVTHPLMAEAACQFQAQAYNELLPPDGPVRTVVMGAPDKKKEQQAQRVKEFMNYYLMSVMEEYTPETDQMLFYLPLAGSTFKKIYYDAALDRPVSTFVPAENLVVPYETSSLETCPIVTHVVPISHNDLRKQQVSGFYRDIPLEPSQVTENEVKKEIDNIDGVQPSYMNYDVNLLEFHVELDLEGFEDRDEEDEDTGIKLPYIVTISEEMGDILSIRRNYSEEDTEKKKIAYFVHYKFLPGFGFYGLGLIHTIGGLSRTATAALRQLIDAGTLSNLPAGFKARGLRVRDDADPIQPGEFRDVDAPGGAIRDSLMPLPFKGPDRTLFELLGFVVDAAQRFATITDLKVGDGNPQAAVGTTVAMLEQGARVMSAIHKRLHYAMRKEFKILARVMHEFLPQEYPYSVAGGEQSIMAEDFDDRVDVLPVSNPNIFSQAQRIALAQSQLELALQAPDLHNTQEAYRRMYEALGVRDIDSILKAPELEQPEPKDPAQENVDALEDTELKAFEGQAHDAHMMAHITFMAGGMVQQMPNVIVSLQKHVLEHVKLKSREQAAIQFVQENQGQPATEDQMLQIEAMTAQIIAQELTAVRQISQQIAGGGEEPAPDPLLALKQQELAIDEQKTQADIARDQGKLSLDEQKMVQRGEQFDERLESQEMQTKQRIAASDRREMMRLRQKAGETP
jgi:chaperonin GroES